MQSHTEDQPIAPFGKCTEQKKQHDINNTI